MELKKDMGQEQGHLILSQADVKCLNQKWVGGDHFMEQIPISTLYDHSAYHSVLLGPLQAGSVLVV